MTDTVAHLVVDALRQSSIDTLFCLPGVQNDDFFNVLVDARDIRPIVCRHEQGAAYMALGAAQVTNGPAAFCVVPGPGMLNASAALNSAYWGYARVFGIIGEISTAAQGVGGGVLHELPDQNAILQQLTKHAALVSDPADAGSVIQGALDALHTGLPRPVTLEVPVNRWTSPADAVLANPPGFEAPVLDEPKVDQIAAALMEAERPMFIVGSGAYGASDEVVQLAERVQAAVTTRRGGHGVMPTAHELFAPLTAGHRLWADADLVVGIGSRMLWPLTSWGLDSGLKVIQINLDETELNRHGATDIGLHADAAQACRALLDAIGSYQAPSRTARVAEARAWFDEATAFLEPQRDYTAALRAAVPDDGVLVEDVTQIGFASHLFYDHTTTRSYLTTGGAGNLGAGTAHAIGAASATDRPVVGIIGDGGFLFTATELATAAQHDIGVNLLVFNNQSFGNVRRMQQNKFGADRTIASTLENPDFKMFTESFGVRHWAADSPAGMTAALKECLAHDGPGVVEVAVDPMPDPWPYFRMPPSR